MSKLLDCKHQTKPPQEKYLLTRARERFTEEVDRLVARFFSYHRSIELVANIENNVLSLKGHIYSAKIIVYTKI